MSVYYIQKEMGGNIEMVLRETGYEDWKWMELVQEHVQISQLAFNSVEH
jgi:hypothetical protein